MCLIHPRKSCSLLHRRTDLQRTDLQQILLRSLASSTKFHLVETSIEECVDLWLVKGQLLNFSPVVQTEVHQVFARSCGNNTVKHTLSTPARGVL